MSRAAKPANVIQLEKKSHRTKKELAVRKQGEESLLTGVPLKASEAVRNNPRALKEFERIQNLLGNIDKDDDLYGNAINRYCLLAAECDELVEIHGKIWARMEEAGDDEYIELAKIVQKNDAMLQQKRKMMFDIEKENIMTISSSLRSIPKKPETKTNKLLEVLSG